MSRNCASMLIPAALMVLVSAPAYARSRASGSAEVSLKLAIAAPLTTEVRLARPSRAHQWVPGSWERRNNQWAWSNGYWELPAPLEAHRVNPK